MVIFFCQKDIESILEKKGVKFGIIFVKQAQTLQDLSSKINQDIKFVDIQSWKVYEHYKINNQNTMNYLGFFNNSFNYIPVNNKSFENRRSNFQGYHIKAMTEIAAPYTFIDTSKSIYDENSDTYDVTNTANGFLIKEVFQDMQNWFNFSASLYKRKDGKWGPTTILDNGTIVAGGIVESLTSGFAEMIVAMYVHRD